MAYENFTTYTEEDPNSRLVQTVSKSSWTALTNAEIAYVYKDYNVGHFNEDFTHQFELYINSVFSEGVSLVWLLANAINTKAGLIAASEDFIFVDWVFNATLRLRLYENGGQADFDVSIASVSTGTLYFLTVVRDDTGGSNNTGLYTLYIRTGSHEGTLVDTLTVECSVGEQNDFRFLYAPGATTSGSGSTTGYVQNLDINEAVDIFSKINTVLYTNIDKINTVSKATIGKINNIAVTG